MKEYYTRSEIDIDRASLNDLPEIVSIYNDAVTAKFSTADTYQFTVEEKKSWFFEHDSNYPIYVARNNDLLLGWLSVSPYRPQRLALRFTKEISYYVKSACQGKGIGRLLIQFAIEKAAELEVKNYIAIVLDKNEPSKKLLEKSGFKIWGHLPDVAEFDGIPCGHLYYGLKIS